MMFLPRLHAAGVAQGLGAVGASRWAWHQARGVSYCKQINMFSKKDKTRSLQQSPARLAENIESFCVHFVFFIRPHGTATLLNDETSKKELNHFAYKRENNNGDDYAVPGSLPRVYLAGRLAPPRLLAFDRIFTNHLKRTRLFLVERTTHTTK